MQRLLDEGFRGLFRPFGGMHSWAPSVLHRSDKNAIMIDMSLLVVESSKSDIMLRQSDGRSQTLVRVGPALTQGQLAETVNKKFNLCVHPTGAVKDSILISGFLPSGCHGTGVTWPPVSDIVMGVLMIVVLNKDDPLVIKGSQAAFSSTCDRVAMRIGFFSEQVPLDKLQAVGSEYDFKTFPIIQSLEQLLTREAIQQIVITLGYTPDLMDFVRVNFGTLGIVTQFWLACENPFQVLATDEICPMNEVIPRQQPTVFADLLNKNDYLELFYAPFNTTKPDGWLHRVPDAEQAKIWVKKACGGPGPLSLQPESKSRRSLAAASAKADHTVPMRSMVFTEQQSVGAMDESGVLKLNEGLLHIIESSKVEDLDAAIDSWMSEGSQAVSHPGASESALATLEFPQTTAKHFIDGRKSASVVAHDFNHPILVVRLDDINSSDVNGYVEVTTMEPRVSGPLLMSALGLPHCLVTGTLVTMRTSRTVTKATLDYVENALKQHLAGWLLKYFTKHHRLIVEMLQLYSSIVYLQAKMRPRIQDFNKFSLYQSGLPTQFVDPEMEVPIDLNNPVSIAEFVRIWWWTLDCIERYAKKRQYPCNIMFHSRFNGDSRSLLASLYVPPRAAHRIVFATIECICAYLPPQERSNPDYLKALGEFMREIMDEWGRVKVKVGAVTLFARPHYAKSWFEPPAGCSDQSQDVAFRRMVCGRDPLSSNLKAFDIFRRRCDPFATFHGGIVKQMQLLAGSP